MKRIVLLTMSLAAILAASSVMTAYGETIIAHRYNFENNANDSVGTLNGTASAGISYVDDHKSGSQSALTQQSQGSVSVGAYDFGDQFSITAWIKPSSANEPTDNWAIRDIVANRSGGWGTPDGFLFYMNLWPGDATVKNNHALVFEMGDGNGNGGAVATDVDVVTLDQWNHVVATVNKTTQIVKLYVNGVEKASGSATTFGSNHTWSIGAFTDGVANFAGGNIDDVQVYSGVLNAEQVDYLYDHPGAAIPEPSAMVLLGMGAASLLAYAWRKQK